MMQTDHDELAAFVRSYFGAKKLFPTVEEVSCSLGWSTDRVEGAVDGDPQTRTTITSFMAAMENLRDRATDNPKDYFVELTGW